jgi:hypothetical protein
MIANGRVRGALPALGQVKTPATVPHSDHSGKEFRHRSDCASGQPAQPQVSWCTKMSGRDRECPALTGLSGTQRARRPLSRTTVRTSIPGLALLLHLLPSDLGVLARMSVAQLDPAHGAWLLKCDRSCWKSGLRSARFTNAHHRRPSAPPQKMAADPVHCGGQTASVRMSALLRHISIMHLLSLGYEQYDDRLFRLTRPGASRWPGDPIDDNRRQFGPSHRFRPVSFANPLADVAGPDDAPHRCCAAWRVMSSRAPISAQE